MGNDLFSYTLSNYSPQEPLDLKSLAEQFPPDPTQGVWINNPTQDIYWLTLPVDCQGMLAKILEFASAHQGEYDYVVIEGMGGSARPPDVSGKLWGFRQVEFRYLLWKI